jgi:hypothetical protein
LEVESYQLGNSTVEEADAKLNQDVEEDYESNSASTSTKITIQKFPPGTYFIDLDQPGSHLACEILEPENANGFVEMKVIKPQKNQQFPIFRYMKSEKLTP